MQSDVVLGHSQFPIPFYFQPFSSSRPLYRDTAMAAAYSRVHTIQNSSRVVAVPRWRRFWGDERYEIEK
jgi:hypothetical protein